MLSTPSSSTEPWAGEAGKGKAGKGKGGKGARGGGKDKGKGKDSQGAGGDNNQPKVRTAVQEARKVLWSKYLRDIISQLLVARWFTIETASFSQCIPTMASYILIH